MCRRERVPGYAYRTHGMTSPIGSSFPSLRIRGKHWWKRDSVLRPVTARRAGHAKVVYRYTEDVSEVSSLGTHRITPPVIHTRELRVMRERVRRLSCHRNVAFCVPGTGPFVALAFIRCYSVKYLCIGRPAAANQRPQKPLRRELVRFRHEASCLGSR